MQSKLVSEFYGTVWVQNLRLQELDSSLLTDTCRPYSTVLIQTDESNNIQIQV